MVSVVYIVDIVHDYFFAHELIPLHTLIEDCEKCPRSAYIASEPKSLNSFQGSIHRHHLSKVAELNCGMQCNRLSSLLTSYT